MVYTEKFQRLADDAQEQVSSVEACEVDALVGAGAIALDIRDPDEHAADHIADSMHISRGKLEMLVEGKIPDFDATVLCYCNAMNRGALSAATLKAMGYLNARYINGGLNAYKALEPTTRRPVFSQV
jgi:rhodanese-related sulfurtransferase